MKEFIGNPIREEYYDEDDVEIELYYEGMGMDNFVYLDPNELGIEIDDDGDADDYENYSLGGFGDTFDDDDDEDYVPDDDDGAQNSEAQPGNTRDSHKANLDANETESDHTPNNGGTVIKNTENSSNNSN